MAGTMQELQDALTAQAAKIDELGSTLTDLIFDQRAAFDALKSAIAAGLDTAPALALISDSFTKLDAAVSAIKAADVDAETISGQPTPIPPAS